MYNSKDGNDIVICLICHTCKAIFTVRCYASMVLPVVVCSTIRLSVCLSHAGIVA